jgi:hypothetical protein
MRPPSTSIDNALKTLIESDPESELAKRDAGVTNFEFGLGPLTWGIAGAKRLPLP